MAVRSIVDVTALEELVDDILHLLIGQHLTIRDGSSSGQGQRHALMDLSQLRVRIGIAQDLMQQGKLPVWHLWGNETDCMVGNPGVIALADILVKGFEGFDKELAY